MQRADEQTPQRSLGIQERRARDFIGKDAAYRGVPRSTVRRLSAASREAICPQAGRSGLCTTPEYILMRKQAEIICVRDSALVQARRSRVIDAGRRFGIPLRQTDR